MTVIMVIAMVVANIFQIGKGRDGFEGKVEEDDDGFEDKEEDDEGFEDKEEDDEGFEDKVEDGEDERDE